MAVYTDVSFEELEVFLAAYDLGEPHVFKGIAEGVSNSNYYLQTNKGTFILTLYEARVEAKDLPFYLGLMGHLAGKDIPCPTPVHGRDGAVTRTLNGKPAAILSFLDGVSLRRPTAEHCAQAGRVLSELHQAGASFAMRLENALGLKGWRKLARECADQADGIAQGLRALIDEELGALERSWPGDLAVTLNAWCFEIDGAYNVTKGRALIAGYQARRRLGANEIAALPLLCRGA